MPEVVHLRPTTCWEARWCAALSRPMSLQPDTGSGVDYCPSPMRCQRHQQQRQSIAFPVEVVYCSAHREASRSATQLLRRRDTRALPAVGEDRYPGVRSWLRGLGYRGKQTRPQLRPTDNAESTRAIARALELGCTFFDTADIYGHGLRRNFSASPADTPTRMRHCYQGR